MGWQWVTGSGIDSSPFFRVFNPLTQSEKFDNSAEYINEYVPEVHKLHQPFKKNEVDLKALNISLGVTYPYPIVDHKVARKRTRSEEHTSELQSRGHLVCRLLLEKKKQ